MTLTNATAVPLSDPIPTRAASPWPALSKSVVSVHRRDIDGLRAIAVIAVLCNHLYPALFPAGFIGVDIFFVLSGFLITRIVNDEIAKGIFSYVEFYWRRCRRIVPALVVTLAGTWLLGALLLTGPEFVSLGRHIVAAGLFSSNLLLWREVGYFDTASGFKPLLHLWSLGVEEQFYLVWPAAVALLAKRRHMLAWMLGMGAVSLGLSGWLATANPSAGFYLLSSRFWELLAGGALAVFLSPHRSRASEHRAWTQPSGGVREAMSVIGLLLLVAGFVFIKESPAYPGFWALLPVSATVLLLAAGSGTVIGRFVLGNPIAVWFGLISYPLYLWHWPLLSFFRIVGTDLGLSTADMRLIKLPIAMLSILLAYLTYEFIERPAQRMGKRFNSNRTLQLRGIRLALLPLLLIVGAGVSTVAMRGIPSRYAPTDSVDEVAVLAAASREAMRDHPAVREACTFADDRVQPARCYRSKLAPAEVAVFGDSHAEVLYPGLAESMPDRSVLMIGQSGCAPLLDIQAINAKYDPKCTASTRASIAYLAGLPEVRTVLLVSRGPVYTKGLGFGRVESEVRWTLRSVAPEASTSASQEELFKTGLSRTIRALEDAGKRVILVRDVPELGFTPSDCVTGRPLGLREKRSPCSVPLTAFAKRNADYWTLLEQLATAHPGVQQFDASGAFCDTRECRGMWDGALLYSDNNHLSLAGSRRVAETLAPFVRRSAGW